MTCVIVDDQSAVLVTSNEKKLTGAVFSSEHERVSFISGV